MVDSVVIVGGGQAAVSAAAGLRAKGHRGRIVLLSNEPVVPYQRPPLSKKYLKGEMALDRLFLKPERFYDEQAIELRLSTPARRIDRAAARVETDDEAIPYDALILATGSHTRRLPNAAGGALPGVFAVRGLADIDALAPAVRPGARALVVGGGYIGLEAAAVAVERGLSVTLIERAARILERVAAPETADWFRDLHHARGVDLREGVRLDGIERDGDGLVATVDGEAVAIDFVIVGIGIEPTADLAAEAGLAVEGGIHVDETCRTADHAILAAGDCAAFPWTMPDGSTRRIRLESVQNAIDQGAHAAAAALGASEPYRPLPWFWSDQYDARLQIAGLNLGADARLVRPGSRAGGRSVWYFADRRLIAVDAMDDPRAYMQARRWLERGDAPDHAAFVAAGETLPGAGRRSA